VADRKKLSNTGTLAADLLHKVLEYDPDTGLFKWLEDRGRVKAGDLAGTCDRDTLAIRVNGRRYRASHLAVLWMTGKWPPDQMNHRDGDGTNDRWVNLRPIGRSEKLYNRGKQENNSVGFKGVTFHKGRAKFQASIQAAGERRYLGYFDTGEEANRAYREAARRMHSKYARTT
jgi:AP2 domain